MRNLKKAIGFFSVYMMIFFAACTGDSSTPPTTTTTPPPSKSKIVVPKFNRDSAYVFTEKQVAFGPRVPNSKSHTECKNWLVNHFRNFGAEVIEQDFSVKNYQNESMNATNIIAQYNVGNPKRVLLAAHWDTRHISDYDPNESKQKEPVPGADDGASGVAVLLEIGRIINSNKLDLGVDMILFDVEDQGESKGKETTWCLGAQHWSRNKHQSGYRPKYGILLDMVGARNARFTKEEVSMKYAPEVMNKVWKIAKAKGYEGYFVDERTGGLIDDHKFVNEIAKIPMIDIVNRPQGSQTGFGDHWHTQKDNMEVIDTRVLRAVGQTVLEVLYQEAAGKF